MQTWNDKCMCIPAEFCKSRKDGKLYPDPYDCRAYIYCSGGYAYRALCGKGLYYDEETQMCDYDFGSCAGKAVCLMMTSSNGNILRVTGHLCEEFTGHRWIPHKASDAELWCFLWSAPE